VNRARFLALCQRPFHEAGTPYAYEPTDNLVR
jgi:hypothetical protein